MPQIGGGSQVRVPSSTQVQRRRHRLAAFCRSRLCGPSPRPLDSYLPIIIVPGWWTGGSISRLGSRRVFKVKVHSAGVMTTHSAEAVFNSCSTK